jgi:conjugative relaxase-like TrwC/TraI family protein
MHQGSVRWRQRRRGGIAGVVADIAKLSVGREAYYTRELATDHEQYLSGHGESPGRWYGAGATTPRAAGRSIGGGVRGHVRGRHPTTGELLGRPHGRNAVPAFDLVLRPTKSASILYGLGDPVAGRAVLQAHHAGLAEAVAYLDEYLGARRGHGGVQHVSGQGLLAVGFEHRTSREGDPLLHTHLVIANRVQGSDGRWTALDGRDLYRHRLAADAIYRASYQRQLVRTLGVEWTARSFDYPDILRRPTGQVLERFTAGGSRLVLTWWGFAMSAVLVAPAVVLLSATLADADPTVLDLATAIGLLAALVQFLGLVRWPFAVPHPGPPGR